ncbi:pentapeptide repeat-containing protein [Mastigocladopsis repens]|uniref:pentapeptide repeat-containing protein n=1 Tax=Mastigocladopsis repens TaxID=221287 RepID=UPI0012EA0E65|nr:pentapeptide repeat-containing protein [Mastigocladopsis repens]
MYQQQRQGLLFTLSAVLTGATLLAGVGVYIALKSGETPVAAPDTSVTRSDMTQAPVDTLVPLLADTPVVPIQKQQNELGKNLGGVNWKGKDLRTLKLRHANLGGANLANTDLSGVDLSGAILSGANLANAKLTGVNLSNANLSGANLDNTKLDNANLSGADFRGANLDDANLEGAILKSTILEGANLSGAIMPQGVNSR